jgi:hypothetical protein
MAAKATYDYLGGMTLTERANALSLASIPQTYTDLVIFLTGTYQNDVSGASGSTNVYLGFNDDTTNQIINFGYAYLNNTSYGKAYSASDNGGINGVYLTSGSNWSSDRTCAEIIHVGDYSSTTKFKTVLTRDIRVHGGNGSVNSYVQGCCAVYRTTTAINKINLSVPIGNIPNNKFEIGTQLSVYGIEKA